MGEDERLLFLVNVTFLTIIRFCRGVYLVSLLIYSLCKTVRSTSLGDTPATRLSVYVLVLSLPEVVSWV